MASGMVRRAMYGRLAGYYDATHEAQDYKGQADLIDTVFQEHGTGGKRVLDIACGTGEHARYMVERGYDVTGIDLSEEEEMAQIDQKAFTEGWIKHLMDSIDEHLDEETRIVLMESCGRACARSGPVHVARECQGDLGRWMATLRKWHGGEEYVQQDGNAVRLICTECLCPVAKDIVDGLSDTYCTCSLGWMKETFGAVMGKPVSVELIQSIVRGAERCEFAITL